MIKKISIIFLIPLIFLLYGCKAPTTVAFEEGSLRKGMTREDMSKVLRFSVLAAHNPFRGKCFHEYYPKKKREIISGSAHVLTEIASTIEPVFYVLENVTISSHKTKSILFGNADNECLHGNGTLEAWVKGHYEALDYVSKQ
tara:strand:- start:66 stop:491 length:426 start_codon:yes stop_codon:yes gene_type:complete